MTLFSGLFSQVLFLWIHARFSMPFFVTLANNRFLYRKHEIGLTLRHDEELGAHSDLLCFESKKDRSSAMTTTTRHVWSHPGLKPFGNPLPIQCPACKGLRTWDILTADNIYLKCKGLNCSQRLDFDRAPALNFVLGKYMDDGRHGQWLKEILDSETTTIN
jgi:hypothetical protein